MHLFFDTVWKLHIGEIPEKCAVFCKERVMSICRPPSCDFYEDAIAAIKQNALTVGNKEIIAEHHIEIGSWARVLSGELYFWPGGYKTKEFARVITKEKEPHWIELKDELQTDGAWWEIKTIAILTLPEEKKNTMENMTKEIMFCDKCGEAYQTKLHHECTTIATLCRDMVLYLKIQVPEIASERELLGLIEVNNSRIQSTATDIKKAIDKTSSGSVAAPKESIDNPEWHIKVLKDRLAESEKQYDELQSELASLRQQLEQREESIKELLSIAETGLTYQESLNGRLPLNRAIIERARKLISK